MATTPPSARSATAAMLDDIARAGRFALQVCGECGKVHYPFREACFNCLSADLEWQDVSSRGTLIARTIVRISAEPYFQERTPFSTGLAKLDCGPVVVCFVDEGVASGSTVELGLDLDDADRAVFTAHQRQEDA